MYECNVYIHMGLVFCEIFFKYDNVASDEKVVKQGENFICTFALYIFKISLQEYLEVAINFITFTLASSILTKSSLKPHITEYTALYTQDIAK